MMDKKRNPTEYGQTEPEYGQTEPEYGQTEPEYVDFGLKERMLEHAGNHEKDTETAMLKADDTRCGIGCFKPSCLQPFASMFVFVPATSMASVALFAYGIYLMSQVTTLEKQFGITSTQSGLMLGANDIGYMLTVLLWSHFAKKAHRPRLLALSSFTFGICGLISVIPHFLMMAKAGDLYDTMESSSSSAFNIKGLCLARNSTTVGSRPQEIASSEDIRRIAFSVLFIAFALQGIAKAPRHPTMQTYIDDNVPKTKTGVYMGLAAVMTMLGPVFGGIIGGIFSRMYVTLKETTLTPRDPRWIGAWWLGFLVFSCIAFVMAIPLTLFPRMMPNAPAQELPRPDTPHHAHTTEPSTLETKDQEMTRKLSTNQDERRALGKTAWKRLLVLVKAFLPSLLRTLKNPLYMLLVISESVHFLTIMGRAAFFSKYLEQYFRVPMGKSGFLIGVVIMAPLASSMAIGGLLTRYARLTIRGCLIVKWVTDGLYFILTFLALVIMCEQPTIYGLSNPSEALKLISADATNMTCDTECMCLEQDFLPSCGADNRTYFSPCHAGCNTVLPNRQFGDCACVPESSSFNQTVSPGYCEGQCSSLVVYLVLMFAGLCMSGLNGIPTHLTQLRCVQERDRSISIGVSGLLRSIIGFFLGPIVFGRVIDSACILWNRRGYCSLYDADDFRIKMHVLTGAVLAGMLIVNAILVFMTYKMTRYCKIVEWQRQSFIREREASKGKKDKKQAVNGDIRDTEIRETDILV